VEKMNGWVHLQDEEHTTQWLLYGKPVMTAGPKDLAVLTAPPVKCIAHLSQEEYQ